MPARRFIRSERGTISIDWVVLTAMMLGTALAMGATVRGGLEDGLPDPESAAMRGLAVQRAFASPHCPDGVAAVQVMETARVAAGGEDPVDVAAWIGIAAYRTDADLRAEREALRSAVATRATLDWTRDRTLFAAAGCALVARGLDPA
ncbi:hypothetical protein JQC91_07185 [Jannaschia sp. Os4]|uniref:hypothetical protein n=1 Tax=Jannaschia sp. Os4 TaxID=2807617 RepID=UPI00193A270A|nr:hypothetical protein [Jannaschia sp. Os4]MBM2576084.1 hypothetical protein [Jannaschia sp. Os4]